MNNKVLGNFPCVHSRKISAILLLRLRDTNFFNWLLSEIQSGQTGGILIYWAC
jgi:hypothetical protein